jgi:ergothioneine biosynthesis protein EgtB
MHLEAWLVMSQSLAIDLRSTAMPLQPATCGDGDGELAVAGGRVTIGAAGKGFAFDNELGAHELELRDFRIDAQPVSWQRYLAFVEAGGYDEARWWSPQGWHWRQRESAGRPRHLNREDGSWKRAVFGQWVPLDPGQPAVHLSAHEAEAWCRWAGRRLPTEAEWEHAAALCGDWFAWGSVWEWTASPFSPYPGFAPHPYRDYSLPWFDGRPVLRGASFATRAALRDRRYRNFFAAGRNDVFAGFRSCPA